MKFRDYPKKFKDRVDVAGRSYKRWSVTGTFSTTDDSVNYCKGKYYVAPGDIVRWHSNNQIPFGDMLLDFYLCGYISKNQMIKSAILQEKGNDDFWANMTTKRVYDEDEGKYVMRFVPGKSSFKEEVKFTDQKSVA